MAETLRSNPTPALHRQRGTHVQAGRRALKRAGSALGRGDLRLLPPGKVVRRLLPLSSVLLGICLAATAGSAVWAQGAPSPFVLNATLEVGGPTAAVAISADESLLATAQPTSSSEGVPTDGAPGTWRISLYDRAGGEKLGLIEARVGANPKLRFSPVDDLLLVAGDDALQLWSLPISPLQPDQPLQDTYRLWSQALTPAAGGGTHGSLLSSVDFGSAPAAVYWSQGRGEYRRAATVDAPPPEGPLFLTDTPPRQAALVSGGARLALLLNEDKSIALVESEQTGFAPRLLQGHRFAARAVLWHPTKGLVSLDAGRNLIRWNSAGRPQQSTYLEGVPREYPPGAIKPLGNEHLLLLPAAGSAAGAYAIRLGEGRPAGVLDAPGGPESVAVSPTGRYVLVAESLRLRLYVFADSTPPLDYVRRLRELGAFKVGQSYVRLMDERGLSPVRMAALLNEASRDPPGKRLQQTLARLQQAEQEGDAEQIAHWAGQVLALQADHPAAVAALGRLRHLREAQVLQQAREAYNLGEYRVAISLLASRIDEDSTLYPEATELIRRAEARRSMETVLEQVRDKRNLGDLPAARALLAEALRRDPTHPDALALEDELNGTPGWQRVLAWGGGLLLALLGLAFGTRAVLRDAPGPGLRRSWLGWLGRLGMERAGPVPERGGTRGSTAKAGGHTAEPPGAERPRPATAGKGPGVRARRKIVEELLVQVEARIGQLRQIDLARRYTALLMELEAELHSIHRRINDPGTELGAIHQRLKDIMVQLTSLRPERGANGGATGSAAGGRGATASSAGGSASGAAGGNAGGKTAGKTAGKNQSRAEEESAAKRKQPTHYEVLQLTATATQEEIRGAYHKLLKQYHPDLHNASQFDWIKTESDRMSRRIGEAYRVLGDEVSRKRYDLELQRQGRAS